MALDRSPLSIADLAARAGAVARSAIRDPQLVSVLIDVDPDTQEITRVQCGFHREFTRWFGGRGLDMCRVRLDDPPVVASRGRYGREQYRRMTDVKESPFPMKPIDIASIRLESGGDA